MLGPFCGQNEAVVYIDKTEIMAIMQHRECKRGQTTLQNAECRRGRERTRTTRVDTMSHRDAGVTPELSGP